MREEPVVICWGLLDLKIVSLIDMFGIGGHLEGQDTGNILDRGCVPSDHVCLFSACGTLDVSALVEAGRLRDQLVWIMRAVKSWLEYHSCIINLLRSVCIINPICL